MSTGNLDETKVSRISAPTAPFVPGLYLTGIDCPLLVPLARIAHQEFKVFLPDIHIENFDLGTPSVRGCKFPVPGMEDAVGILVRID